jgi:hypothetical protein
VNTRSYITVLLLIAVALVGQACDRKQLRISNPNPGLRAEYYNYSQTDTFYFGNRVLTRTDAKIDFDYRAGKPPGATVVNADRFAVRWLGYIMPPESGKYTICTCADDGVRLTIDGELLIDHFGNTAARFWWAEKQLEKGTRYPFKMDYRDIDGNAMARIYWARNTGVTPEQACKNVGNPNDANRGQEFCDPVAGDVLNPVLEIIPSVSFTAAEDESTELLAACQVKPTYLSAGQVPNPALANTQRARRLFQRLGGVDLPLFDSRIAEVKALLDEDKKPEAARVVTQNPNFYQKTVRSMAARMSTIDTRPDVELNDFTATFIGVTRDGIDARKLLTGNFLYRANPGIFSQDASAFSDQELLRSNNHYKALELLNVPLACALDKLDPYSLTFVPDHMRQKLIRPNANPDDQDLTGASDPNPDPAGVLTSRAFSEAHAIAGTGRRIVEKSFEQFLCAPIETWRDADISDQYIGRDVERFPNGPASYNDVLTTCKTCHGPMDAMRPAFSRYHFDNGYLKYAPFFYETNRETNTRAAERLNRMKVTPESQETPPCKQGTAGCTADSLNNNPKIPIAWKLNHNVNYADGFFVKTNSYNNLLTSNRHMSRFGWSGDLNGTGARAFGRMLANSRAFPACMARRVYAEVCRDDPFRADFPPDMQTWLNDAGDQFAGSGYLLRELFESIALKCLD